jgi:hypothetical protein
VSILLQASMPQAGTRIGISAISMTAGVLFDDAAVLRRKLAGKINRVPECDAVRWQQAGLHAKLRSTQ